MFPSLSEQTLSGGLAVILNLLILIKEKNTPDSEDSITLPKEYLAFLFKIYARGILFGDL